MVKRLSNTDQNSKKLTNIPTPVATGDAANKSYVDTGLSGKSNVGHTHTIAQITDYNPAQPPNPYVEGVPYYSYGHSYTRVPSPYTTPNGGEYPVKLSKRLGFGTSYFRGRGGTPLIDQFSAMLAASWGDSRSGEPTIDRTWTPGSRGVVTMQHYMNEAGGGGVWLTQSGVDYWGVMLRSAWALLSSKEILPVSAGTYSGTWVDFNTAPYPAMSHSGGIKRTATAGSYVQFTVTGDKVYVIGLASASGVTGTIFQASCNGTSLGTKSLDGIRPAYTSVVDPTESSRNPAVFELSGLNAIAGTSGNKTIRLTHPGGEVNAFLNGIIIPSNNPPQIFYGLEPPRVPENTNFWTANPMFRSKVNEIALEFPNVTVVDLAPDWDNDTMISSIDGAGFHPNDRGQSLMADHFQTAINAKISDWTNGVATL